MSIRAVWILSPKGIDGKFLIYTKRFPVVEKKEYIWCNQGNNRKYQPLPDDGQIAAGIMREIGIGTDLNKFNEGRDSCDKLCQKPVYEIDGKIWPMVISEKFGLIFACLPLVNNSSESRPPIISIPGVSMGLSLLDSLANILGPVASSLTIGHSKLIELNDFLTAGIPFGTPIDLNPLTAKLQAKFTASINPHKKQPAWKPSIIIPKTRNQINITIKEEIRASIYNRSGIPDVWDLYGSVTCKADLEGKPDIIASLSVSPKSPPLVSVQMHSCVYVDESDESIKGCFIGRKIRFSPPTESFNLCNYISPMPSLPIKGIYEMKGDQLIKVFVSLQLDGSVTNSFEYCEVHIPIFNRGPISKIEVSTGTTNVGSVGLAQDKKRIIWNIGTKFPRNLEATLNAVVLFDGKTSNKTPYDDRFCIGKNAYAQVRFKINGFTFSSFQLDPQSITISPNAYFKPNCVTEFTASQYRIWNSFGDVPIALTQQLQNEISEKKLNQQN